MHETYQSAWHAQENNGETCWDDLHPSEKLPPLKHSKTDANGFRFASFVLLWWADPVRRPVRVFSYVCRHLLALWSSPLYHGPASVAVDTSLSP